MLEWNRLLWVYTQPRHWQSGSMQLIVSVASPRQLALSPNAGSLHARALIFDPWPQVVEHWDHSPHSCQLLSTTEKFEMKVRMEDDKNCGFITLTCLQYTFSGFCSIPWTSLVASYERFATLPSPEFRPKTTGSCALGPGTPVQPFSSVFWNSNTFALGKTSIKKKRFLSGIARIT